MKKQYNTPELVKVLLDTKDIMTLSNLLSEDIKAERDTFEWKW